MRLKQIGLLFLLLAMRQPFMAFTSDGQPPIEMGRYRQLFIDDYVIEKMQGVKQVLNQPRKHPLNPILAPEQPWEGTRVLNPGVSYDEQKGVFTMDYQAHWPTDVQRCRAISKDGILWQKPNWGMVEFEGSATNNIFRQKSGSTQGLHTPWDPDPQRQYKKLGGRHGPGMVSPDGIHWTTPPQSKKIINVASDSSVMVLYDPIRERYLGFTKTIAISGGHDRRSYGITISDDFLLWTPMKAILVPDARDDELARQRVAAIRDRLTYDDGPEWYLAQMYQMRQIPYEGMVVGLLMKFDLSGWPPELQRQKEQTITAGGEDGICYYELASSRDLEYWNRVGNRDIFLPIGAAGSWDGGCHDLPQNPLIVGDEIRFYYGSRRSLRGTNQTGAIGLATLRLDGWVSVDAGPQEGTLTTRPLVFQTGQMLVINAAAQKGSIAVEILDATTDQPLTGFDKAMCQTFSGDAIRHTVTWDGNADPSGLADLTEMTGKPVRLRFYLQNAKLFSFTASLITPP